MVRLPALMALVGLGAMVLAHRAAAQVTPRGGECVPSTEICDGVDNDCDTFVDEDLGLGQQCSTGNPGACEVGVSVCGAVGGVICVGASPVPEVCLDDADNDCDGMTDESEAEICDEVDNDCDTFVDEELLCDIPIDVDGDGEVAPLTDMLLLLRWSFGFTGNTLILGAVGDECSRCTGEEIVTYIEEHLLTPLP